MSLSFLIRWCSYPAVFGLCALAQLTLLSQHLPYWPLAPLVVALGLAAVALLERCRPYQIDWTHDQGDTVTDLWHTAVNLATIFVTVDIVAQLRATLPWSGPWPQHWPLWQQLLGAGLIIDFGLWLVHWLSHKSPLLWRLHAIHHSAERLYWLNGERRHPLSALAHAAPGIAVLTLLGAPAELSGCWFSIMAVHLAFQHANLDYSLGPLRYLLGVAEVHRWHHKREYEDAQVNFGEFLMLWDHLFGTFRHDRNGVAAGDVGLRERLPAGYRAQLWWPFAAGGGSERSAPQHESPG